MAEAFAEASRGLFTIILGTLNGIEEREQREIHVTASDEEALLVEWLNETLFLLETEGFLLRRVEVADIGPTSMTATAFGEVFDPERHAIEAHVKATTYHQLQIDHQNSGTLSKRSLAEMLGIRQVYDVAHNIAKIERHMVDAAEVELCVHRKGATRAFPPGHPDVPSHYRHVGQPVLIPGDMGRYSFIAVGTPQGMVESWGSACHGAGRLKSRTAIKKELRGQDVEGLLREQGVVVRAGGWASLAEEMPEAYKDIAEVVDVTDAAGLARRVARTCPIGVIKG